MKKILLLLLLATGIVEAQNVNIPNANFKLYLANVACVDTNGDGLYDADVDANNDGEIQLSEALSVTSIQLQNSYVGAVFVTITNAEGIQSFTNLTSLNIEGTELAAIDFNGLSNVSQLKVTFCRNLNALNFSPLTSLSTLLLDFNESLSSINLSGLPNLTTVTCNKLNFLNTLDLSNHPNLQTVTCTNNYDLNTLLLNNSPALTNLVCTANKLSSLNLTTSPNLTNINVSDNKLTAITFSTLPLLQNLNCKDNLITGTLDVTASPLLTTLNCSENRLTALYATGLANLTDLDCGANLISALDFTGMSGLLKLDCSSNLLTSLNLNPVTQLNILYCGGNKYPSIDVSMMTSLSELGCGGEFLTAIDVSALTQLTKFSITSSPITALNVSTLTNLTLLVATFNPQLTALDVTNLVNLTFLGCLSNALTSLDVSHNTLLTDLYCSQNDIPNLDVSNLSALRYLDCGGNQFSAIDFSNNPVLDRLDIGSSPMLEYINFKNGYRLTSAYAYACPNLRYICEDEPYILSTKSIFSGFLPAGQLNVTSYCSFVPGGDYNTITGSILYDLAGDGCDVTDFVTPYVKININDGTTTGTTFTSGNYSFYTEAGNFTITPQVENPTYFNISPANPVIHFPVLDNSTQTQNFCITANGIHPDVEVTFLPINTARPGFDAEYIIVYKNKGNQMLSGLITLDYESNLLDFVNAAPAFSASVPNQLRWTYSNLQPFETRYISLTLHVHTPPDVDLGDILDFTANINPVPSDETPDDNVFDFNQEAVNSLVTNSITCLEGETIAIADVGRYLHYNVDFENVGTADAVNVVVKVVINTAEFNINSLQLQYASHEVEPRITGNVAEFIFRNIHLNGGPIGGHGNVLFKIRTLPNLVAGDDVVGIANIYFDYNTPVQTDEERTVIAGLGKDDFIKDTSIIVAPNPAKDFIRISAKNTIKSIQLFDAQGRILQTVLDNKKSFTLDISNKAQGVYFLKVTTDKGSAIQKIIKE